MVTPRKAARDESGASVMRGKSSRTSVSASRASGPKTEQGKATSSRNALAHGATSPKLLNDLERVAYAQMLAALQRQYPSGHPLVQLQLERIARLKVQLDRIQSVMDAAFVVSRQLAASAEHTTLRGRHANDLTMGELEWRLMGTFAKYHANLKQRLDEYEQELISVCQELSAFDGFDQLTTHQHFEQYLPRFCQHLLEMANAEKASLEETAQAIQKSPYSIPQSFVDMLIPATGTASGSPPENSLPLHTAPLRAITAIEVRDLQECATRLHSQMKNFLARQERLRNYDANTTLQQEAAMPDPEKMDRLMRYQTTINRQLSSAIGELLALTRSG